MLRQIALVTLLAILLGACAVATPRRESANAAQLPDVTVFKSPT